VFLTAFGVKEVEKSIKGMALALCVAGLAAQPAMADDVSTKGGIKVTSDDGSFVGEFGGRLMLDGAVFDNDAEENTSGTEFRRIRLHSKGKIYGLDYKVEFDFADGDTVTKDAYLAMKVLGGKLTVGQFKQYFTMENLTSSRYITFMERSYLTSFSPDYNVGVGYWGNYGAIGYGVSAYNAYQDEDADGDDGPSGDNGTTEGTGGTARVIFAPKLGEYGQIHIGGSMAKEGGVQGRNRVRVRPAGHLSDASRVAIVDINTGERSESTLYGLEFAGLAGPLSVQAEYVGGTYETDTVEQDVAAFYAYTSYFLTGEVRPYDAKSGKFGRVKPRKSHGAVEVAVRYDYVENDSIDFEVESLTVGANWYWNPQVRFMLNYIASDVAEGTDEPNAVTARMQFDF
jgi:phosphate-selective porin OprO/OprP